MTDIDVNMDTLAANGIVTGEFCGSEQGAEEGFTERFALNLGFITRNHWSFIGPAGGSLLVADGTLLDNARIACKKMGYRFRVKEARWNNPAQNQLTISITIINEGSAPFYYPWPVHIILTNSGKVAEDIEMTQTDWDCRTWLPGESVMTATILLPSTPGDYKIRFSINDPTTALPGILFANEGLDPNGRYLLGSVKVMVKE